MDIVIIIITTSIKICLPALKPHILHHNNLYSVWFICPGEGPVIYNKLTQGIPGHGREMEH